MSTNERGHRGYQRFNDVPRSNPDGPSASFRRPGANKMSVAKKFDGKKSVYMTFLHRFGKNRFLKEQKQQYDQNNPTHLAIMTEYYSGMPESLKRSLQKEVDEHNKNRSLVSKTKYERTQRNRELRRANPEVYQELLGQHLAARNAQRRRIGFTEPVREIHVAEDLELFCQDNRRKAKRALISYLRDNQNYNGNPVLSEGYSMKLISIFPIVYSYKYALNKISCYPAEIAITTFNIPNGIIHSHSKMIFFDSHWYYQGDGDTEEPSRRHYAKELGISENGHPNGELPDYIFQWLSDELTRDPRLIILCDKAQFNFVYYGINTLATYTGINAKRFFQEKIVPQLLSIQDYTSVLLETVALNIPPNEKWSDEQITNQFLFHRLIPRSDHDLICSYHEGVNKPARYNCVKAHSAKILYNFYEILKQNKLHGFQFLEPLHETCILELAEPGLPKIIKAETVSRQLEKFYLDREQSGSRRVYSGNNEYNVAYEDFDNSDSEDEYDEDDHGGPYYVTQLDDTHNLFMSSSTNEQRNAHAEATDLDEFVPTSEQAEPVQPRPVVPPPVKQKPKEWVTISVVCPSAEDFTTPKRDRYFNNIDAIEFIEKARKKASKEKGYTVINLNHL